MVTSWKHSPRMMTILWPCFDFNGLWIPLTHWLRKTPTGGEGWLRFLVWSLPRKLPETNTVEPDFFRTKKNGEEFSITVKRNVSLVFCTSTSRHEHWMRSAVQSLNWVQWSCQRWFVIFLSSVPWVCIETYLCTLPQKAHKFHIISCI